MTTNNQTPEFGTDEFILAVSQLKGRLFGLGDLEELADTAEANPQSEVYRVAALEGARWADADVEGREPLIRKKRGTLVRFVRRFVRRLARGVTPRIKRTDRI